MKGVSPLNEKSFRKVLTGITLLFFLSVATPLLAAVSISTTVDKTDLGLSDTIELSVRINGTQNAPSPNLPSLPDFKVEGMGTSSSIQMINGTVNSSVTHLYRLTPKSAGDFVIGPVTLEMDGNRYVSPKIKVHITKDNSGIPKPGDAVFAEAVVSRKDPYVNEQVILSYRLYRKGEVRNFQMDVPQGNFRRTPLGEPHEYTRVLNGIRYNVYETRFTLTPMRAGQSVIPTALLSMDLVKRSRTKRHDPFQDFFDNPMFGRNVTLERKNLRTEPIPLNVKPLPEKGKPKSFSNLVGQFTLSADLSENKIMEGGTATLHLKLHGWGNLEDAKISFPEEDYSFRVYPDQPQLKQEVIDGRMGGEKLFSFAIVPESSGKQNIPEFHLNFFDPEKEQYQQIKIPSMTLEVLPATAGSKNVPGVSSNGSSKSGSLPESGLLPIHTGQSTYTAPGNTGNQVLLTAGILILSPMITGLALMFYRQRVRLKLDTVFFKKKMALKNAEMRLNQLEQEKPDDEKYFAREVSQILREYIGDKLNFQGTALTVTELETVLKENNIQSSSSDQLCQLLERCESLQYATVGSADDLDVLNESRNLIRALENLL